ncbi:hypothetical protein LTR27_007391 [Elasticomyces elasticus]|nr:hypothetical protein LTR27_007391 [Elasticomyces elasticus]
MEQLNKGMGSLLLDPKYSDLEITCEGRNYYVHRNIDGGDVLIEHNISDPLTLERILLFIYTGDYTVTALTGDTTCAAATPVLSQGTNRPQPNGHTKETASSPTATSQDAKNSPTASIDPAIAHVLVYAVAGLYEMTDLQKLAIQKFKDRSSVVKAEDFAKVALAVYQNTSNDEDALRDTIIAISVDRVHELTGCEEFIVAMASDFTLQPLTARLLPAAAKLAKDGKLNARISAGLNGELREAMLKLQEENKELRRELSSSMHKADEYASRNDLLRYKLTTAQNVLDDERAKSSDLARDLGTKTDQLNVAQRAVSTTQTTQSVLERKEREIASLKGGVAVAREEADKVRKELTLKQELIDDLENNKKSVAHWKSKYYRRDTVLKNAIELVNGLEYCARRSCGKYLSVWILWDDRDKSEQGKIMAQCKHCNWKHYG